MSRSKGSLLLIPLLACVAGCHRGFFASHGSIASQGGVLGRWDRLPAGCTRTPFDGQPAARSTSVATFLWQSGGDAQWRSEQADPHQADEPERLEISRAPAGFSGGFHTVLMPGAVRLDGSVCRTLQLDSWERPASIPEGRPSLSGRLQVDCNAKGSHLVGDFRFSGCTY